MHDTYLMYTNNKSKSRCRQKGESWERVVITVYTDMLIFSAVFMVCKYLSYGGVLRSTRNKQIKKSIIVEYYKTVRYYTSFFGNIHIAYVP